MTVCPLSPREKKEKLLSKRNRNISRKKKMGKYAICPRKKRRASWARGLALPPPEDARHDTRQNHEGNAHKTTNRRTLSFSALGSSVLLLLGLLLHCVEKSCNIQAAFFAERSHRKKKKAINNNNTDQKSPE